MFMRKEIVSMLRKTENFYKVTFNMKQKIKIVATIGPVSANQIC